MSKAFILVIYGWVTNCLKTLMVSQHFWGSRIWKQLNWVVLEPWDLSNRKGLLKISVTLLVGAVVIWRLVRVSRINFQCPSDGCQEKAVVLYHACLSVELLTSWQLTFPRASDQMKKASVTNAGAIVSFITWYQKWHSITCAIFCWLHRPTLVQCAKRLHKSAGDRDDWGP